MTVFVYILVRVVSVLLFALELLLLARAITSWLPFSEDSPLVNFLLTVTEPIVLPVRNLLERSETISAMPFDLSLIVTYFILIIVQLLLPTVNL